MRIEKKSDERAVIIPPGKIDITNSHELKMALLKLYDDGCKIIEVDFTNITNIDSSGLGKLLLFQKKLKERQGELKIVNISSEYIRKMFTMIHLYKVIDFEPRE